MISEHGEHMSEDTIKVYPWFRFWWKADGTCKRYGRKYKGSWMSNYSGYAISLSKQRAIKRLEKFLRAEYQRDVKRWTKKRRKEAATITIPFDPEVS